MSDNTDYGFDLDSILAEFSSDSGTQDTEPPKPARHAAGTARSRTGAPCGSRTCHGTDGA